MSQGSLLVILSEWGEEEYCLYRHRVCCSGCECSCLSFTRSEEAFEILRPEYIHGTGMKVNPKCPADDVSKRSQSPAPWQLIKPFFRNSQDSHSGSGSSEGRAAKKCLTCSQGELGCSQSLSCSHKERPLVSFSCTILYKQILTICTKRFRPS